MNKLYYIIIGCLILALGFSAMHWLNRPVEAYTPYHNASKNCVECHQNSIEIEAWKGMPSWHNEKFCNPVLNAENREAHRQEAHLHRNKCMTCHAPSFQAKCANCHTQNELKW